jgi:hypothetical protein
MGSTKKMIKIFNNKIGNSKISIKKMSVRDGIQKTVANEK